MRMCCCNPLDTFELGFFCGMAVISLMMIAMLLLVKAVRK